MKTKKYFIYSFGEIKSMSKKSYLAYLKAVKDEEYDEAQKIWDDSKHICVIDINVTDLTSEQARYAIDSENGTGIYSK